MRLLRRCRPPGQVLVTVVLSVAFVALLTRHGDRRPDRPAVSGEPEQDSRTAESADSLIPGQDSRMAESADSLIPGQSSREADQADSLMPGQGSQTADQTNSLRPGQDSQTADQADSLMPGQNSRAADQLDSLVPGQDSQTANQANSWRPGQESRTAEPTDSVPADESARLQCLMASDLDETTGGGRSCQQAERHGSAQRVISYSLFQASDSEDDWDRLLTGVEENAALSALLYPGWVVRVHHDAEPGSARRRRLVEVACQHRHVDLCYVLQPPTASSQGVYRGALWRFFPMTDPLVDVFVSRDLDSRLSHREAAAVADWLTTNKTFHIMRDHWNHQITVPGGLWGAQVRLRRDLMLHLGRRLAKWLAHPGHKNWDQRALQAVVWWHAAVDSVQHDSYTCQRFPGYTVPFPTQRRADDTTLYLGQVVAADGRSSGEKLLKCPPQCRPPQHQDWEYC